MATFHVNVTTGAGTPIYRQIIDQVRLGVATGALRPGQAMPSVRSLAERLVVNANTAVKAYAELVRDGGLGAQQGSVFALSGRTGACKTTTIRMFLGLLEPPRGSSVILGYDSVPLPPEARARIGYMAEGHPVYGWMRVGEYGRFQRGFYHHWNQEI